MLATRDDCVKEKGDRALLHRRDSHFKSPGTRLLERECNLTLSAFQAAATSPFIPRLSPPFVINFTLLTE